MNAPFNFYGSPGDVALVANHNVFQPESFFSFSTVDAARRCAREVGNFGFWRVKGWQA